MLPIRLLILIPGIFALACTSGEKASESLGKANSIRARFEKTTVPDAAREREQLSVANLGLHASTRRPARPRPAADGGADPWEVISAKEQARSIGRYAALAKILDDETVDPQWRNATEDAFRGFVDQVRSATLTDVDCRATLCRATFYCASYKDFHSVVMNFRVPSIVSSAMRIVSEDPDGGVHAEGFFAREGHRVPRYQDLYPTTVDEEVE